jgi:hypothetical protein
MEFACYISSYICYTSLYADLDKCLKCKTSHLNKSDQARQMFSYMPLIPCLYALMLNETYATHLQYCADKHKNTCMPGTKTDIFDELHYCSLLGQCVVVGDQRLTYNYFSDDHDIALNFATDSFAPFKKWKHTA